MKETKQLRNLMESINTYSEITDETINKASTVNWSLDDIDMSSIELGGVDAADMPDYADVYVYVSDFKNGTPLTDEQLDYLTDTYPDVIQDRAFDSLL